MLKYPNINVGFWKDVKPYDNDDDIKSILDRLLTDMDCSQMYGSHQVVKSDSFVYESYLSHYYYYLLRMRNQFTYNEYFDKLIASHNANKVFEDNIPIVEVEVKIKAKSKSKTASKRVKNEFVRQVTTDLITGAETYMYSNAKTGEVIQSDNPDMLETLNTKKKKVKEPKVSKVKSFKFDFRIPIKLK